MTIMRLNGLLKDAQKSICSCFGSVSGMEGKFSVVIGFGSNGGALATHPILAAGPALSGAVMMRKVLFLGKVAISFFLMN